VEKLLVEYQRKNWYIFFVKKNIW